MAAQHKSLFVFVSYDENPVALETEAVTQVENIDNAMKTGFGAYRIYAVVVLLIFPLIRNLMDLGTNPVKFIDDPGHLFIFSIIAAYVVMFIIEKINYRMWYKKAAEAAYTTGVFTPVNKNIQPLAMIAEVILLLLVVEISGKTFDPIFLTGVYVSLALASGIFFYCERLKKPVRVLAGAAVIVISIAVMYLAVETAGFTPVEINYNGEINMPVSMEKLNIRSTEKEYVSQHKEFRCFLYNRYQGSQKYLKEDAGWLVDDFSYTFIKVKSDSFCNSLKKDYLHRLNDNKNADIDYWKAEETYSDITMTYKDNYKYQIFYDDAILILRTPTILSTHQISTIVTNLVEKYE